MDCSSIPLKASENNIGDGGTRNVKLENGALFQTLEQNEHVAKDPRWVNEILQLTLIGIVWY